MTLEMHPKAGPICRGSCGFLQWTIDKWGRLTHKHACSIRAEPYCQTHPRGCPERRS